MQIKLRAKFGCNGRGKNKINVFIKKNLKSMSKKLLGRKQ